MGDPAVIPKGGDKGTCETSTRAAEEVDGLPSSAIPSGFEYPREKSLLTCPSSAGGRAQGDGADWDETTASATLPLPTSTGLDREVEGPPRSCEALSGSRDRLLLEEPCLRLLGRSILALLSLEADLLRVHCTV